jgi:polysaccharide export outer membrane protein
MKLILQTFLIVLILASCGTQRRLDRNFTLFQKGLDSISQIALKEPVIKPNDLLSIQVLSKPLNQEQVAAFNYFNGFGPGVTTTLSVGGQSVMGHLVSESGNIYLPYIGNMKVEGLTTMQLRDTLELKLSDYVKKPEILIRFLNFKINVLGEVRAPGTKTFTNQKITILDAIGLAGDLTDQARRDSILVIREDKGMLQHYYVDLRSGKFMNSPVYQLQQNDVIYIQPNDVKLKTVKRNPNVDRDIQLTLAFVSIASSLLSLIYFITK